MQDKKPVVLFDIDFTLFDRNVFLDSIFSAIASFFKLDKEELSRVGLLEYNKNMAKYGHFRPDEFISTIVKATNLGDPKKVEEIIAEEYKHPKGLYKESLETLNNVSEIAEIGIFSKGNSQFQQKKMIDFKHLLTEEHVHISTDKLGMLPEVMKKYRDTKLYLVDDLLDVLYSAKKIKNDLVTVWIKKGPFAQSQVEIPGFTPDAVVENLSEVVRIVKQEMSS